ncbi:MAG: ABC-2 family transporter protein [Opitutaceae bacterium]|nr:ABC-2 family transporter protein [Opitutaceae bacterium]
MSPYLALLRARFRLLLHYRAAALAGIATQIGFGLILTSAFAAFYGSDQVSRQMLPLSLPNLMTYLWLGQALLGLLPWRMDGEVKAMVTSGGLAYELLRPVDLYGLWFSRAIALRTAPVLLRAIPLLILAGWLFGLSLPPSIEAAGLWTVGLAGAVALSAACTVLMSISLLWTLSGEGVQFAMPAFASFFSGHLLPLALFPDWAGRMIALLPFRGLMDTPHRLWIGTLEGAEAWGAIAHQWVWVALLVVVGRFLLSRGLTRVVIQGG